MKRNQCNWKKTRRLGTGRTGNVEEKEERQVLQVTRVKEGVRGRGGN